MYHTRHGTLFEDHIKIVLPLVPEERDPQMTSDSTQDFGSSTHDLPEAFNIWSSPKSFSMDLRKYSVIGVRPVPCSIATTSTKIDVHLDKPTDVQQSDTLTAISLGILKVDKDAQISRTQLANSVKRNLRVFSENRQSPELWGTQQHNQMFDYHHSSSMASCTWHKDHFANFITPPIHSPTEDMSYTMYYDFALNSLFFFRNSKANDLILQLENDTNLKYLPFLAIISFPPERPAPINYKAVFSISKVNCYASIPSLKQLARRSIEKQLSLGLTSTVIIRRQIKKLGLPKTLVKFILGAQLKLYQLYPYDFLDIFLRRTSELRFIYPLSCNLPSRVHQIKDVTIDR